MFALQMRITNGSRSFSQAPKEVNQSVRLKMWQKAAIHIYKNNIAARFVSQHQNTSDHIA
jgi:hypothetical protein